LLRLFFKGIEINKVNRSVRKVLAASIEIVAEIEFIQRLGVYNKVYRTPRAPIRGSGLAFLALFECSGVPLTTQASGKPPPSPLLLRRRGSRKLPLL
jgi:hypothetical protein